MKKCDFVIPSVDYIGRKVDKHCYQTRCKLFTKHQPLDPSCTHIVFGLLSYYGNSYQNAIHFHCTGCCERVMADNLCLDEDNGMFSLVLQFLQQGWLNQSDSELETSSPRNQRIQLWRMHFVGKYSLAPLPGEKLYCRSCMKPLLLLLTRVYMCMLLVCLWKKHALRT